MKKRFFAAAFSRRTLLPAALTAALALFSLTCNMYEDNGALVDPGDPGVSVEYALRGVPTISASPAVLAADGSSKSNIAVQVRNRDGNPIAGSVVVFYTDAGTVTARDSTDADGKASARLTSERRNTVANVTAYLEGQPYNKVKIAVEFSGVAISANASPETIKPDGADTSVILAVLLDAANNPIVGERVAFTKTLGGTVFVRADSATNSRGEARCVVRGRVAEPTDWITVSAAGAETVIEVNYSEQLLAISSDNNTDRLPSGSANTTTFYLRYTLGDGTTPLPGEQVYITVTAGTRLVGGTGGANASDVIFARGLTTNDEGIATFTINNPNFAGAATVSARGFAGGSSATVSKQITFIASSAIGRLELAGTPDVIGTNNGKAKLTVTAYDPQGNRVGGAPISFNIRRGSGGGEYIDPPAVTTAADGTASVYLMAGSNPSDSRGVEIVASDYAASGYSGKQSNSVYVTIAGPPRNITVRRNIDNIAAGSGGTYSMKLSALVTDVNNNPVPDGTEVTFSSVIAGYRYYRLKPRMEADANGNRVCKTDTLHVDVVSEDVFSRGTRPYRPFPDSLRFKDINRNGFPEASAERCNSEGTAIITEPETFNDSVSRSWLLDMYYIDEYNMLQVKRNNEAVVANGGIPPYDIDWNGNGVADPKTAVIMTRTVLTRNGVADNEMTYGQSDAWKIRVKIWAECQGLVTSTPEEFILPKADGARNWHYFE
jgi:hypothetical protein